ncbi:phospholipase D-like domain-containing protein [Sanguibacter suaedae]|uniref:Phosphatidylserine/phosphatidylglycerophosphate/ cardiolipin synthase family protein n=1 Tax=Sanguibacter suaedae TaxID=2795737 RepID=A0A934IED8_9MICO|nr:phospholipase D-like domain-containing protein [Sanguibacter suaedae]MBI9115404.1 phosphatidylserine/phosphatidylglycerophosphate/cardiolipin synthase family protein [Sanguibacter suaedae]
MEHVEQRVARFARQTITRSLVAYTVVPLVAASVITAADHWKKRSQSRKATFPHTAPKHSTIGESTTTIYTFGVELYEEMIAAIEAAEHHVYLETYIWKGDGLGQRFKDALIAASERGVSVHVVYDGFANLVVPRKFFEFPPEIQVLRFPVFRPQVLLLDIKHSGRDHRKILVVDDEVGFVGGYNLGSLYATQWRDTHLRITGPAVWELSSAFQEFWNLNRTTEVRALPSPGTTHWEPGFQAARNAPVRRVYPIRNLYLEAVRRATSHVYLTQAYFIPDRELLAVIVSAARRGVDVRVIVPEASNHVLTDWLSRGLYSQLLRAGVTIWLYRNAMVHAKTATVDGLWTTIGTANIDRLSLSGNYEINMAIYDATLAAQMEEIFEVDLSNCRQLHLEEWERRSPVARLGEKLLAPLSPLL